MTSGGWQSGCDAGSAGGGAEGDAGGEALPPSRSPKTQPRKLRARTAAESPQAAGPPRRSTQSGVRWSIGQRDGELEAVLSRYMNECALRGSVYAFAETGSTMEDARALAAEGAPEGTLVYAARQAQGRGRLGRVWESPEGGAYFSIILRPKRPAADIPQLSLVAGLAAVEGLRQLARVYPSIRWPNDVLIDGKKLAGILVEARHGGVIVGVGINVATKPSDLPETAVALAAVAKPCPHPHQVTGAFWRRLSIWYDIWAREGFGPVRAALRPWMGLFGQPVHVTAGSQQFEGTAADLDESGRLVVRLDSGVLRAFEMGEVTLLR